MKTRLPRQEFLDALTAVAAITGGRTTKPILTCVKLTSEGEALELSATDGEAALRLSVSTFSVDTPGETVVSADRLLSIVRELPDAEIVLETDARHCQVRGAGGDFKIFVQSAADFPSVPTFEDDPDLVVDGRQLGRMIDLTVYAAAREMSRYAINGVLWSKKGKKLFMVATDGRRLARAGGSIPKAHGGDFAVIVPGKALHAFKSVFNVGKEPQDWEVEVKVLPNQILLRSGDRMLATVLVEGSFPDYERVIPDQTTKVAKLPRVDLYGAIRRAALLTSDEARAVRLAFGGEEVVITANSPEQGEARVQVPADYEGEAVEIGFNPNFVNDALKVLTCEHVRIELTDSFRPGVLSGEDKNDFLYVVMPVSL
ncbi:MAG: DNA polymerase III subunit beta [Phycisphaerales bacterium]|nr:DNA polymerase III subunit beta [Phycisphaerales bacterium]